jgi:hypothetical protein
MSTEIEERQIQRGGQDGHTALVEQVGASYAHAETYKEPLVQAGLDPGWYPTTKTLLASVMTLLGSQTSTRDGALSSTMEEGAACSRLKAVMRQEKTAAEIVLANGPVAGVYLSSFMTGPLGKSTKGVLEQAARIHPFVVALEEPLKRYFKGQSPTAVLDQAIEGLIAASDAQESKHTSAPLETRALRLAKGKLLDQLELLNRVARIAFDGDAQIRALFNKDILLRARRGGGRKAGETSQTDTPVSE